MPERAMAVVPFQTAWDAYPGKSLADVAQILDKGCEKTKIDPGGYGGIIMVKPNDAAVEAIFDRAHQMRAAADKAAKVIGK